MKDKLTAQDWGRLIGKNIMCDDEIHRLTGVKVWENKKGFSLLIECETCFLYNGQPETCKPILRRLEDMTQRETEKYFMLTMINTITSIESVDYLDEIGVDQRNWIDAGLAIDAKEINNENN